MESIIFLILITITLFCFYCVIGDLFFVLLTTIYLSAAYVFIHRAQTHPWMMATCFILLFVLVLFYDKYYREEKIVFLGGVAGILSCILFIVAGEKIIQQFLNVF
jgi:membrane-bound metal-dependent hydrolase YbcI (DUF457 family)